MRKKSLPTTSIEIVQRRDELFEALSKESDRGVVLISAAFLEEALESLLRARFSIRQPKSKSIIDGLFDNSPLSTFSAKIKICYTIDLIGEWMYRDLETVRKLRNDYFAHSVGIARFDLPAVVQLTETLKAADLAVTQITKGKDGVRKAQKTKAIKKNTSTKSTKADMERVRFVMSVSFIGAVLYFLARILSSDIPLQDKEKIIESILLTK